MSLADHELFIFDWDGTLSTSTLIVRISNLLKLRYRKWHMMKHREEYLKSAERKIKVKERTNRLYANVYNLYSAIVMPRLKEGSIELLKALKKRKKKIAVFSDSEEYRLMVEARTLGVLEYVDFVLSASAISAYKPNPTGLLLITDKYKVGKKKTIYIGDMPSDIMTAKFAGISSCGVGDGLSPLNLLKEVKPDYLFKDIGTMLKEI